MYTREEAGGGIHPRADAGAGVAPRGAAADASRTYRANDRARRPADAATPRRALTLAFPTADVVLLGARFARLVELLHDHSLGSVTPLDARYSNALGKAPWVARIVVSGIDKSGGAAG